MCGIYGIFDPSSPLDESTRAWSRRAQELLRHRGPDDQGCEERLHFLQVAPLGQRDDITVVLAGTWGSA